VIPNYTQMKKPSMHKFFNSAKLKESYLYMSIRHLYFVTSTWQC